MSLSNLNRRFSHFMLMAFFAFQFASGAAAQDADPGWDAAAVGQLATELEKTLQEAYARSLKAPPQQTVLQQRTRDAAQGAIRRARDLSADYARKLRAGYDRDASEPYFRAVANEVAYVWETAADAVPAETAKPLIERLQKILEELTAHYDAALSPG